MERGEYNTSAKRNVMNVDNIEDFANFYWPQYEIFKKHINKPHYANIVNNITK